MILIYIIISILDNKYIMYNIIYIIMMKNRKHSVDSDFNVPKRGRKTSEGWTGSDFDCSQSVFRAQSSNNFKRIRSPPKSEPADGIWIPLLFRPHG